MRLRSQEGSFEVFHLGKQPRDLDDQSFEVNLIEGLTNEHDKEIEYESKGEFE